MDNATIGRVLAEEIRTNVRLRREMGMAEGDSSGVEYEDDGVTGIRITTTEGQTFAIGIGEVSDDDNPA